ncbi:hypothetical protein THASP1DRAFT_33673, partial [Thamnocephalis sphaerospora]
MRHLLTVLASLLLVHAAHGALPVEYHKKSSIFLNGKDIWNVPAAEVVVGYKTRCADGDKELDAEFTHYGNGVMLNSKPLRVSTRHDILREACPVGDLQVCQIIAHRNVWDQLAKVTVDTPLTAAANVFEAVTLQFGYDAPPVVSQGLYRFIPAHLLGTFNSVPGAFTVTNAGNGKRMLVGDDGGARPLDSAIFRARCSIGSNVNKLIPDAPRYEDPDNKTFRRTSSLVQRRIVAVGDLHGDL